jgi:hypothetical protein
VFKLDDLFASLVSVKGFGVSLIITKCTGIKSSSDQFRSTPLDELSLQDSSYEVSGQILDLLPFWSCPTSHDLHNIKFNWVWNGDYVSLNKYNPQ